jgi:hypothetical protein
MRQTIYETRFVEPEIFVRLRVFTGELGRAMPGHHGLVIFLAN